jgi:plasmid stabilization system protein ParE
MTRPITFRPEAEEEIAEAYRWYEEQQGGVGAAFLVCTEECLAAIAENPKAFGIAHKDIRKAVMRRFPYVVYFLHTEPDIVVLAVFHAKRNPRTWRTR